MGGEQIGTWTGACYQLSGSAWVKLDGAQVRFSRLSGGEIRGRALCNLHRPDRATALVVVLRAYEAGQVALTCAELQVLQQACAGTVYLTEQSVRCAVELCNDGLSDIGDGASIAAAKVQAVRDWLEAELP